MSMYIEPMSLSLANRGKKKKKARWHSRTFWRSNVYSSITTGCQKLKLTGQSHTEGTANAFVPESLQCVAYVHALFVIIGHFK